MKKELTGARESNAGDDFHFIWTAKKALKLLEPNTDFKALCVEGPSHEEELFEDDRDALLSIDVAEYFGGERYEEAHKVVFSQLKYSTRRGNKVWSLSELSTSTNKKGNNSIIKRLSQTYKGYCIKYPYDIDKLTLKLVSNRSIEEKLAKVINESKLLIKKNKCLKYRELIKYIPEEYKEYLKLLYDESTLSTTEFIGFIMKLDLTECGAGIREIQQAEAISTMANLGIIDLKMNYDKLLQFIRKQMSPEENEAEPIKKNLMANFFNVIPTGLFPAICNVVKPSTYVKRDIIKEIVNKIIIEKEKHVCLHATGGMGKTTVITDIESSLPNDSVVLIYDCFGGGAYLDPSTPIHKYKNAIVQLSNELALKCYTPFLVGVTMDENECLNSFSNRLRQASEYVKKLNEEAVILIVIDAIDNSFIAANNFKDKSFVENFLKITLPDNVSILVTSRTERLDNFELPYDTVKIELQGLNENEQYNFLKKYYPDVSLQQCEEIRMLTNGNPRVQNYVFSRSPNSIDEALQYLKPNGKELFGIFKEALEKVDKRVASEIISFEELCRALVELPRPIPIDIITASTDYDVNKLESACSDYLIGIYFDNGKVTFRDEDFEEYLRRTTRMGNTVIPKISKVLYELRYDNYYSIKYLHIFLEKNKQLKELIESIYSINCINVSMVQDEINEILAQRIKSAFFIDDIYSSEYRLDVYKLLYIQSKCHKTNSDIKELIIENIELAKAFGFSSTISRVVLEGESFRTLNNITLRTYCNILLQNDSEADECFSISCEMIKQYLEKDKNGDRTNERVERNNISQLGLYLAMRYDVKSAFEWLQRWSPYPIQEFYDVMHALLINGNVQKANELILLSDDVDMFAACLTAFINFNYSIKEEWLELLDSIIGNISRNNDIRKIDYIYRIKLAEILLENGKVNQANIIVNNTKINIDYAYISFDSSYSNFPMEYAFKLYVIRNYLNDKKYSFDDFCFEMYSQNANEGKSGKEERYNKTKKVIDFVINSFFINISRLDKVSASNCSLDEFINEYRLCKSGIYNFYNDHNSYSYYRMISINIFPILLKQEKEIVKQYCVEFLNDKYYNNSFHFRIIFELIRDKKYIDLAAWYIYKLEEKMSRVPQDSYAMKEFYLECSRKAMFINKELGKMYFVKSMQATAEIDEDAYQRIELFEKLSEKYIENENSSELAYNFTRIVEDSYRRLDDSKNLPIESAFKLISQIHPSSAIAAACRLEDRDDYNILGYKTSIPVIVNKLLENKKISVEVSVALSNLDISYGMKYSRIIENVLENLLSMNRDQKNQILEVICEDIEKISNGFDNRDIVKKLLEWQCNIEKSSYKCIEVLNEKYSYISKKYKTKEYRYNYCENESITWDKVDKKTIELSKESIELIMNKIYYQDRYHMLNYILKNAKYNEHILAIELLVELVYTSSSFVDDKKTYILLIDTFKEWSNYNPDVKRWLNDEDKLDWVLDLYYKEAYYYKNNIYYISEMFYIDNDIILSKVMKIIKNYLMSDSWKIHYFMKGMLSIENSSNCSEMLEWCCSQEIGKVHINSSDEEYTEKMKNNYELEECISIYLIKMLAHAEKEKRWYAVHSIYNLFKMQEDKIIEGIFKFIFDDIPDVFKDKRYVFFRDIAVTYFFISLRRIAEDNILVLEKYMPYLTEIATTDKTINILQRELAKEIVCLKKPNNIEVLSACEVVNTAKIKGKRNSFNTREREKTQFSFDNMDIVPKVYYYIAEIFGKSNVEFKDECDKMITSLGFTNSDVRVWNEIFKTANYQRKTYGIDTPVDDLSKYIQYNAMFYVADYYRKTACIVDEEYSIYTFSQWIKNWLTRFDGRWISEIKTTPPNISLFLDTNKYINEGKYIISDDVFKNCIFYEYNKEKYIILNASNSMNYMQSYKRYNIEIGLMDSIYIPKLLNKANVEDYWIQHSYISEGYNKRDDYFIEDVMGEYYEKDSSLERYDPYASGICSYLLKPNTSIENYFNMFNIIPIDYSIGIENDYAIKSQYWSYSNDERMYKLSCEGKMLFIKKEEFCKYLSARPNIVVVVQVNVNYSDDYDKYGEKSQEAERRRIILMDNQLNNILNEVEVKISNNY